MVLTSPRGRDRFREYGRDGFIEETAVESVPVIAALHHSSLDLAEPFAGVATRPQAPDEL